MENTLLKKLKLLRKEKKLSQEEIANKIGMAKESYRDIESGKNALKMDVFFRICKAINIKPEFLVQNTNEIIIVITPEQAETIKDLNQQIQNAINFNNIQNNTFNGDFIIGNKYGDK